VVGKSAGAVTLLALLVLPFSPVALADSGNLLPNGSFQSGTSGWTPSDAAFTIASDGNGDNAAGRVALSTSAKSYQLAASPRPVQSTTAGTVYTASGVVRSDTPGKSVCLLLKELTSGGTLVLTSTQCATTTSQWGPFPQVTLTAQSSGDKIAFLTRQSSAVAGDSYEVDDLSLVASSGGGGGGGSPPSTPTNVIATAVSPSEIDVSWTASTDPDPDGVAGYTIYRDGGGTPVGSVGPTTSFADTSVGPGETHTYTVAAFDPEGHSSQQSAPSNPATTPQPSGALVGLWHLDEQGGTTAFDSSGHGHNGSLTGPVTVGVPGETNTAYSFVPKSAVNVPDAPDLRPGTANITVSYWMNATVAPPKGDYDMFVKGQAGSNGGQIKLEVQPNGHASCMFRGSQGGRQLEAGPNLLDGQWHHVICQRIGTQIVENVDGATFSVTQATGAITVTEQIRFGAHEGGGDWYNGRLDEVSYTIG
jgi:hypothetical protein